MKRVLMVDDNSGLLFAFRLLCAAYGVSAETADSLKSALWQLKNEQYDILISDMNLTGANEQEGLEIVRVSRSINPLMRVFIWTAYDSEMLRDKLLDTGIEGYLTKPVKFEKLLSIINNPSEIST